MGKKLHFMSHGIHHDYPRDSTRLVMPLLLSLPLATILFIPTFLFWDILDFLSLQVSFLVMCAMMEYIMPLIICK